MKTPWSKSEIFDARHFPGSSARNAWRARKWFLKGNELNESSLIRLRWSNVYPDDTIQFVFVSRMRSRESLRIVLLMNFSVTKVWNQFPKRESVQWQTFGCQEIDTLSKYLIPVPKYPVKRINKHLYTCAYSIFVRKIIPAWDFFTPNLASPLMRRMPLGNGENERKW